MAGKKDKFTQERPLVSAYGRDRRMIDIANNFTGSACQYMQRKVMQVWQTLSGEKNHIRAAFSSATGERSRRATLSGPQAQM